MGRASSSKKVAKAARAGSSSRTTDRKLLGFPAAVTAVVVLGVLLVIGARAQRTEAAAPTLQDHWHSPYGIYVCDAFTPIVQDRTDPLGIHTHADGIIHIHPLSANATGDNAKVSVFFDAWGGSISDDMLTTSALEQFVEGVDTCDGEDAVVQVAIWEDFAVDTDPTIVTDGIADIQFDGDRMAYTFAFVPEGTEIPKPEPATDPEDLADDPGGTDTTDEPDADATTTTSADGGEPDADATTTTSADE